MLELNDTPKPEDAMTREEWNAVMEILPAPTDAHMEIPDEPYILWETPKAMLLGFSVGMAGHEKQVWVPKSQLASGTPNPVFGVRLYIKRGWVARERLWWIFK